MIIRIARVEDAPAMARVNLDPSDPENWEWMEESARNWARAMQQIADGTNPRQCVCVAEDEAGRIVGFVIGGPPRMDAPEGTGEVYNLSVEESYGVAVSAVASSRRWPRTWRNWE